MSWEEEGILVKKKTWKQNPTSTKRRRVWWSENIRSRYKRTDLALDIHETFPCNKVRIATPKIPEN